jgi:hypothetical protein
MGKHEEDNMKIHVNVNTQRKERSRKMKDTEWNWEKWSTKVPYFSPVCNGQECGISILITAGLMLYRSAKCLYL